MMHSIKRKTGGLRIRSFSYFYYSKELGHITFKIMPQNAQSVKARKRSEVIFQVSFGCIKVFYIVGQLHVFFISITFISLLRLRFPKN